MGGAALLLLFNGGGGGGGGGGTGTTLPFGDGRIAYGSTIIVGAGCAYGVGIL